MSMVGKYEVLEPLGSGSIGTVYRARDTMLEREVALKTIRTGAEIEPEVRERFYREARACARLQHPNIVTVYDLGEAERTAYIAMELLVGSDFRKLIEQRRELPLVAKLDAMVDVCDALSHAHANDVIHRDVKPSNLFFLDNGHAKVLDFGIAKLPSSRLTVAGKILGTPNYMAPEQILCRPSDGRADLFSAAVVFFELLVYVHPFHSSLIPRRIVEDQPDSLFDHDSHLPPPLARVFARALSKDPEGRYPSCDELAADLRAVADGVRQNASPTFSRLELPSDRAPVMAPAPMPPADPGPEDEDDRRLSEVLRLVREFDEAIDAPDAPAARRAFDALKAIEATDSRFTQAVQGCWARLTELTGESAPDAPSAPGAAAAAPAIEPPTHPKECGYCGAGNRSAAVFCIRCGAPFNVPKPAESPASPATAPINIDATLTGTAPLPQTAAPTPPRSPSPPPPVVAPPPVAPPAAAGNRGQYALNRRTALIAGGAVCVLTIVLLLVLRRPVKIEPHVATAAARFETVQIYEAPNKLSRSVASVARNERLNVLDLPRSRDQEWVRVQHVTGKLSRPGFARVDQLTGWHSRTPDLALALVRMFGAGETGSEDEIKQQITEFDGVTGQFPNHPVRREALLESARLRLALAKRYQDAGRPADEWQAEVRTALENLQEPLSDSALAGAAGEMRTRAGDMLAKASPVPPAAEANATPEINVERLLSQAEELRKKPDFAEAKRIVHRVLRVDPNNAKAKALLQKIADTEDLARETR